MQRANGHDDDAAGFPFLRERGPLALIGLSTAIATPFGWATGRLGETQLRSLDSLLERLADGERYRVILLHHSPLEEFSHRRKRLVDAHGLREVIARRGADLVLHGHEHISIAGRIAGRDGALPVFGAACARAFTPIPSAAPSTRSTASGARPAAGAWRSRRAATMRTGKPFAGRHGRILRKVRGASFASASPLRKRGLLSKVRPAAPPHAWSFARCRSSPRGWRRSNRRRPSRSPASRASCKPRRPRHHRPGRRRAGLRHAGQHIKEAARGRH